MSNDRNTDIEEQLAAEASEATLLTAMQTLEVTVERIVQSRDRTMMLLTQGLPDLWTAVVLMLKTTHGAGKMVSVEATEVEPEHVQMVLDGRRFLLRYMALCNRCLELFDEALMLHEGALQKPIGNSMESVMERQYGDTFRQMTLEVGNQVALNIADIKSQTEDALNWLHDSLLYTRMLVETIIRDGHEVLKPFEVTNKDLLSAIITGFRKYVAKHHRRIEKQLKHQTNPFRPKRTSPLTPEVWGALYEVEEKSIDAAISEVLVGCSEFAFIDSREKLTMQENRELLARIMLNCIDEELFNFKDGMEVNDLLTDLTGENLLYFYERVHRRNLIQIGMFPHLKEEYEEFLKGNDHPWERASHDNDALHFDNEDFCLAKSNVIFNTRIQTTEEHYRKVRDVILRFIKQEGVASDVEQINPSAQNEWYYIMKGICESGMARSDMGDTKFAGQMVAWFPDMFADKIGEGNSKDFVRNFAKSISAERNNYWTEGAERKEVAIIDMHAHARTRSNNIDNGKAIRAFGIANGLKKVLEELKTEIQKAQSAR